LPPVSCWFLAWLALRPRRWRQYDPLNCWLTFAGLHVIILQMIRTLQSHYCEKFKPKLKLIKSQNRTYNIKQ
jgi:hypothetical protein